jgi:hypothetical protein
VSTVPVNRAWPAKTVQATPSFLGGWPAQGGVLMGGHREQVITACEGLFAFDLGPEAGVGGAKW